MQRFTTTSVDNQSQVSLAIKAKSLALSQQISLLELAEYTAVTAHYQQVNKTDSENDPSEMVGGQLSPDKAPITVGSTPFVIRLNSDEEAAHDSSSFVPNESECPGVQRSFQNITSDASMSAAADCGNTAAADLVFPNQSTNLQSDGSTNMAELNQSSLLDLEMSDEEENPSPELMADVKIQISEQVMDVTKLKLVETLVSGKQTLTPIVEDAENLDQMSSDEEQAGGVKIVREQVSNGMLGDDERVTYPTAHDASISAQTVEDEEQISEQTVNDEEQMSGQKADDEELISGQTVEDEELMSGQTVEDEEQISGQTVEDEEQISGQTLEDEAITLQQRHEDNLTQSVPDLNEVLEEKAGNEVDVEQPSSEQVVTDEQRLDQFADIQRQASGSGQTVDGEPPVTHSPVTADCESPANKDGSVSEREGPPYSAPSHDLETPLDQVIDCNSTEMVAVSNGEHHLSDFINRSSRETSEHSGEE